MSARTWSATENEILFRAVVCTVLTHRGEIYSSPGLEPWSSSAGSRINDKIQQLFKKFGNNVPGAADIVKQEVANLRAGKSGTPKSTPTKDNKDKGPSTPKKRKVKVEDEDDVAL